jgi:CheY-like chemotaxis protein
MQQKRILVVDDEAGSSRLMKANLELTGLYEVRVETQSRGALAAARSFKPDFIFLDVVMPQMSGLEVARAMRRDPELKTVQLALLTAVEGSLLGAEPDPLIRCLPRLAKPVEMVEILQFLESHLTSPPTASLPVPARRTATSQQI